MFRQDRAPILQGGSQQVSFAEEAFDRQGTPPLTMLCRLVFVAALAGAIVIGVRLLLDDPGLSAAAETPQITSFVPDQSAEIAALRAEVDLLTQQSMELRAELALLTGQRGVLSQMIGHLQEQRRVNAAHSNALRQLFSTPGVIGAALPGRGDTPQEDLGARPVQVTPVNRPETETPQRVVLIPQEDTAEEGAGDGQ